MKKLYPSNRVQTNILLPVRCESLLRSAAERRAVEFDFMAWRGVGENEIYRASPNKKPFVGCVV